MLTSLDQPPSGADGTIWADYAEIRALAHPDKCFTLGDLSGVAQRAKDIGGHFDAGARWRDILGYVNIRLDAFGPSYPFVISEDGDTLSVNYDATSAIHRTYLGLLIASSMRTVDKQRWHNVARVFEEISYSVFSKLLPTGTQIRATWAGAGPNAPYQGTLYQKLTQIASDLRCKPNFDEADFSPTDTGDGGMDIVAWHPMNDQREGMPIAVAQCSCSRSDWSFKQMEAHPAKHLPRLPVMHPWANYYFMPLDFRRADGGWAHKSDLGQVIVVDRLRIMKLVSQYEIIENMPNLDYVDEAWRMAVA